MRSTLLLLAFAMPAFADHIPDHHTVNGSRIWPPAGPIWTEGPLPDPAHGCAEPALMLKARKLRKGHVLT
jgi:hypothetical protein